MSRIRSKDTEPELVVRSTLHRLGYRFRLRSKSLPGKPDIVLSKHKAVVMVNGCFWHRHKGCKYAYTPKSRVRFWASKFAENVERDTVVKRQLRRLGWRVFVVWECQTRDRARLAKRLERAIARTS